MIGNAPPFWFRIFLFLAIGILRLVSLAICDLYFPNSAFCFLFSTTSPLSTFSAALQIVLTSASGEWAMMLFRTRGSRQTDNNLNARLIAGDLAILSVVWCSLIYPPSSLYTRLVLIHTLAHAVHPMVYRFPSPRWGKSLSLLGRDQEFVGGDRGAGTHGPSWSLPGTHS